MKKAICLCVALLLIAALSSGALAVEPLAVHVEGFTARDGALNLYWASNLARVPDPSEVTLQVGSQSLPVQGVKTLAQAGEGATYLMLADISGSIGAQKLARMKQTMLALVSGMGDKDNAGILLVGDDVDAKPLTQDKTALTQQIQAIQGGAKNTNLYLGISKGLELLDADAKSNSKRLLVVLSDGAEFAVKGITREEVNAKIAALHIPVYTVAMLGANPAQEYVESSKVLGSFARLSPGGVAQTHDLKEETSTAVAKAILSSVSSSLVLTVKLDGLTFAGNEQYMKLELNAGDFGKASDGYNVPTGDFAAAQATPAPSPSPSETAQPASSPTPVVSASPTPGAATPSSLGGTIFGLPALWVYLGAGALVLLIAALILAFAGKKKKRLAAQRKEVAFSDLGITQNEQAQVEMDLGPTSGFDSFDAGKTVGGFAPPAVRGAALRLTKVGNPDTAVYTANLTENLTIGRKAGVSGLTFPEDDMLSSRHCELIWRDHRLFIRDLGSTNGTFVNGVKTFGEHELVQDDVMLIGSMELRINWDE